jgi:hypothetical protein
MISLTAGHDAGDSFDPRLVEHGDGARPRLVRVSRHDGTATMPLVSPPVPEFRRCDSRSTGRNQISGESAAGCSRGRRQSFRNKT